MVAFQLKCGMIILLQISVMTTEYGRHLNTVEPLLQGHLEISAEMSRNSMVSSQEEFTSVKKTISRQLSYLAPITGEKANSVNKI